MSLHRLTVMGAENMPLMLNGKEVNVGSLQIENIHRDDWPDFCDAYFAEGEYADGTPLNDAELETLTYDHSGLLNETIHDRQLYL